MLHLYIHTLRYTSSNHKFLVLFKPFIDFIVEVFLCRVTDCEGIQEPDAGLLLVLGDGVALGRQLARDVLIVAAVLGLATGLSRLWHCLVLISLPDLFLPGCFPTCKNNLIA